MSVLVEFEALFKNFIKNRNNPRSEYWEGNTRRAWYKLMQKPPDQRVDLLVAVACIEGYVRDWKYLPRNNRTPLQIKTNKLNSSAHYSALWLADKWSRKGQRPNISELEGQLVQLHAQYFPNSFTD